MHAGYNGIDQPPRLSCDGDQILCVVQVHPTTKQHKLIGQAIYNAFNGVLF